MISENTKSVALDEISAAAFNNQLDDVFTLRADNTELKVKIAECVERPKATGYDAKRTAFRLVFKAEEPETHPLLNRGCCNAAISGLEIGDVGPVLVNRILRPVEFEPGIYLQVCFN